jgi:uncharacterized protein YxjI
MATVLTTDVDAQACPKCGYVSDVHVNECPRCQVILDKVAVAKSRHDEMRERSSLGQGALQERLAQTRELFIQQQVEKLEAFTGFETRNRYTVADAAGSVLFHAEEEGSEAAEVLTRVFLKSARPFTLQLETLHGEPVLRLQRPFRFYFHELDIYNGQGALLGSVRKRFSALSRRYVVIDHTEGERYELLGPLLRPWTFRILRNGQECGAIKKKWSGLTKEMFTDADAFGVELPEEAGLLAKSVLLGAVFLIDFVHFEGNARN